MGSSSNNWSFSFYEESYEEMCSTDAEDVIEDTSKTSILSEGVSTDVVEAAHETQKSVYNPFLLTKMNYFKRRSSKVKLRVFDKRMIISRDKVIKSIHPVDQKNKNVLFWKCVTEFNKRKGCPTETLIITFARKVGCKPRSVTVTKEQGSSWYTLGV
ncbi:hypothetical protein KGF57_003196 [Candida theae]|uniref:Uncharacterized protein n=1 Tax=Candida theae TaxID=1198502 RepID=A0AAD5FY09_9ASCO|nr:uncharacterized protein KGF57_003196 [Candida theae]KAI5957502.1 hypothetical protein KGF57_003196 [Candida theae]